MRRLTILIPLLLVLLVLLTGCAEKRYRVMSGAMFPTLQAEEIIIVNRSAYVNDPPERGDVVALKMPDTPDERINFKRVVALGGDTVRVEDGRLYVNDMDIPVDEPYIAEPMAYTLNRTTIPEGHVYVLGDNRNDSNDSHRFGPLPIEDVVGKVRIEENP
jgi:signal peptidase I